MSPQTLRKASFLEFNATNERRPAFMKHRKHKRKKLSLRASRRRKKQPEPEPAPPSTLTNQL